MKRPVSRINRFQRSILRAINLAPLFLVSFFFFFSRIEKAPPNQFRDSRKILLDFTRDSKRKLRSINFYLRHVTLRGEYFSPIFLGENGRPPIYRGRSMVGQCERPATDIGLYHVALPIVLSEIPPI